MRGASEPTLRVLVASHSHPAVSKGGAELAAWRLFEGLRGHPDWQAWFLGCGREASDGRLGSGITQPFGEDEFLYASTQFDWFKFSNADPRYPREFERLLLQTRPDILHFHHYVNFGAETFMIAKRALPDCRIVLTLHEFQAICNHYGQMVTRQNKRLCYAATPRDCNRCFPDISPADFFLRASYIKRFFDCVDLFVAPSHFLADRFIGWGIDPGRMAVIENVIPAAAPAALSQTGARHGLRVGFFGQISLLKGIRVLLEAARMLEDDDSGIVFEIHGDHSGQPAEFQADFLEGLAKAGPNVRFHGSYDNERVDGLMRGVDLVLIPSIWWENSPVVIQECLRNRRPILCSDIGGMAEKVQPGRDGWHFPVGSAHDLCARLRLLAEDPTQIGAMTATMRIPDAPADAVERHIAAYRGLLPRAAIASKLRRGQAPAAVAPFKGRPLKAGA